MSLDYFSKAALRSLVGDSFSISEDSDGTISLKPKGTAARADSSTIRMDCADSYQGGKEAISSYEKSRQDVLNYESPLDAAVRRAVHQTANAWRADSADAPPLPAKNATTGELLEDSIDRYKTNLATAWKKPSK